jgi:competence protein ComEC
LLALLWPRSVDRTEAIFLDVGQGDATLLLSPHGIVLIDGGGWRSGDFAGRVLVPALARLGIAAIDLAVLSHGDRDHCGGLVDLTHYLRIERVWMAPGATPSSCGEALIARLGERVALPLPGQEVKIGDWRLRALASPGVEKGEQESNRGSLIVHASAGDLDVLLTGDVDAVGERRLLATGALDGLAVDVLKVAHHGSRSSSTVNFLTAAAPRLAVVSAGRMNPYGHPTAEVIERLRRGGAMVLRTDLDGRIRVSSQGGALRLEVASSRELGPGQHAEELSMAPLVRARGR